MELTYHVIDAFAAKPFEGNPAGVCVLDAWLPNATMQAIAAENRLSETAFCVRRGPAVYDLRWFTPTAEIDLCGHATFGTAYVLFEGQERGSSTIRFHAPMKGYNLVCTKCGEHIQMEFPRMQLLSYQGNDLANIATALGAQPTEILCTERDLVCVFEHEETVNSLTPNLDLVEGLEHGLSVYVTAPSASYDYVARAFWPKLGIPEDPVCGSMQSALVPYWSARLGKSQMVCRQTSSRGGTVWCEDAGNGVHISGTGARYLTGTICIPDQS
ncbi:MAG: PhzF family phenazine biosynthesis protein [Coriobacteriales bacterium]|nr:PhzF family phenazine biosynthesis protein [Coriobacteriales bacterium]